MSISTDNGTKYLHPKGVSPYPYILPEVYDIKNKPHIPLSITEGEKKTLIMGIFSQPRKKVK